MLRGFRNPSHSPNRSERFIQRNDSHRKQYTSSKHLKTQQLEIVFEISDNFDKKIRSVVQLQVQLAKRQMPQRCSIHNSVLSLYCERDRKTLCASCIYQNDSHRKHNILSISEAKEAMKQDIVNDDQRVKEVIMTIRSVVQTRSQNIKRTEMEFPALIRQLETHYERLRIVLIKKEKEQIQEIKYLKQKLNYQNSAFVAELNRIATYLEITSDEKLNSEAEDFLTTHQIFTTLSSSDKIVNLNNFNFLKGSEINANIVNPTVFAGAEQHLQTTLVLNHNAQNLGSNFKKETIPRKQLKQRSAFPVKTFYTGSAAKNNTSLCAQKQIQTINKQPKKVHKGQTNQQKSKLTRQSKSLIFKKETEQKNRKSVSKLINQANSSPKQQKPVLMTITQKEKYQQQKPAISSPKIANSKEKEKKIASRRKVERSNFSKEGVQRQYSSPYFRWSDLKKNY